jgi:hypothetical protein
MDYAERDKCKPVLLRLLLTGNLIKQLMSLYGTEWRERGYGLCPLSFFYQFCLFCRGSFPIPILAAFLIRAVQSRGKKIFGGRVFSYSMRATHRAIVLK